MSLACRYASSSSVNERSVSTRLSRKWVNATRCAPTATEEPITLHGFDDEIDYRGGIGDPAGLPDSRAAVGARGGQDQRGDKPARSSYTTIHAACRSFTDSVSLVLMLPVSPVLLATRVLVVPVRGPVVPVFPVLPLVAHLAGFPQSVKPVRSKNRPVPCGLCRNS